MKFKFCADGDCPLWALSALHALGTLPAPIFKSLLQHVTENQPDDGIKDILKDTNLASREECARAAVVLRWTLKQAHRCNCSGVQLARDMLVLGVPRAHAGALAETVDAGREAYEQRVRENAFFANRLTDLTVAPGPPGSVDTIKLIVHSEEASSGEETASEVLIDKNQAHVLLDELKEAYKRLEELKFD